MKKYLFVLTALLINFFASAQSSLAVTKLGHLGYETSLNDIWGYVDSSGREYALVGLDNGFSVVDVSIPANPVEKFFIGGALSIWRDVKTYDHYAYVVHDAFDGDSDGIMIVDLDSMNTPSPKVKYFYPTVTIDTSTYYFYRAHNLYIDENGILYVFGSNVGAGGALMFDLKPDPENPVYLGVYNELYLHDGMARGDTLWAAAINVGDFMVIDVSGKSSPLTLASHPTSGHLTHNCWISDDGKTLFTTDEVTGAYIGAYDVSDLQNISELDRLKISYGGYDVIPHNVHVLGDFLVTSYYTSGLQIVDATMPDILIETAYYDTSPFTGGGFRGAWGAYPYLPSGNILVSDVEEGLFILSSTFPKGCYFTGAIRDSISGKPISNVGVEVLASPIDSFVTDIFGKFAIGARIGGSFQAVFNKTGYYSDTVSIDLVNGVEEHVEVALLPQSSYLNDNLHLKAVLVPNPSSDYFELRFPGDASRSRYRISVTSLSGEYVFESSVNPSHGETIVKHNLLPGVYIVQIISSEGDFTPLKLVVSD